MPVHKRKGLVTISSQSLSRQLHISCVGQAKDMCGASDVTEGENFNTEELSIYRVHCIETDLENSSDPSKFVMYIAIMHLLTYLQEIQIV